MNYITKLSVFLLPEQQHSHPRFLTTFRGVTHSLCSFLLTLTPFTMDAKVPGPLLSALMPPQQAKQEGHLATSKQPARCQERVI